MGSLGGTKETAPRDETHIQGQELIPWHCAPEYISGPIAPLSVVVSNHLINSTSHDAAHIKHKYL